MNTLDLRLRGLASRCGRALERLEERVPARAVIFLLVLVLIGGIQYALNAHTPLMMDDYDYSFSWSTGERVSGLSDVIASQAVHYRLWGGRSVVHALAQLFLSVDKAVFDVANTAMYLLLLLELYALARPKGRTFCWPLLLAAHAALFTCVPFFGTVFLWLTGSCNYLWGTALALMPLLVARDALEGGALSRGQSGWLAVPVSFIAGWTNENTACGVLMLMAALLVGLRLAKRRVRAWQWASLAAQAAGTAVMLLAPGNFVRASGYSSGNPALELVRRLVLATAYGAAYIGVLLVAALLLHALCKALGARCRGVQVLLLLLGGAAAAYSMVASPVFSDRSWTGVFVLALCAALTLLGDLDAQTRAFDAAKLAALPLALALVAYGGYQALGDVRGHEAAWQAQVQAMEEAAAAAEPDVTLDGVESHSRFTMEIALSKDAQAWPNSTLTRMFGIRVNGR